MMRSILVGIVVLLALGVGLLTFDWYRDRHGGSETYGGAFVLVDHSGKPITEAAFRGSPAAIFFGFTHCPEVCPTTLYELDGWLKALGPEGEEIRAFFVSVDPERDTPEVLGRYVTNVSDRIVGITGEPEKVHAMLKAFNIYWRRVELEGGDYTMDHTASIILLDRNGGFAGTIAYGENPDNAVEKLRRLAARG
jgi:protein SCO1/2